MRRIGREATQSFERVLQTRQRVVEDRREAPELIFCVVDGKPLGERFRGDLPRLVGHGADRSEYAAGEEIASRDRQPDSEGDAHREDGGERPERVPQGVFLDRGGYAIGRSRDVLDAIAMAVRRRPRYG